MDFAKFKYIVDNFPISELTSKTNTIAHIFKKDYRENFISDWLAFLFDPLQYGGYEPLNAFLSLFPSDVPICFFQGETILIEREYAFKDGRRIDFLITGDEYIIGIENKIDSYEGNNQLKDYYKSLKELAQTESKNKKIVPIFLKPKRNLTKTNGGFHEILYEDLIESFKMIRLDFINNLRFAFLMEDFINHMEEYILDNEYRFNESVKFIVENNENLGLIKKDIDNEVRRFVDFLKKKVSELKDNDEWETNAPSSGSFVQLFKISWKKYLIHYELVTYTKNLAFPDSYELVLHCESKDIKDEFSDIKLSAEAKYHKKYNIDFSSEQNFSNSISQMIDQLNNLKCEYTDKIDTFVLKFESKSSSLQP
ncbi:MAG: PD-(D/E)XK nuclease family protein [Clostridiales bacterium]|nr:PD-(D/E)XK nuclease family protein [Clostridiales bacterium]